MNTMRIDAPAGTKVRWAFIGNGYKADQDQAAKHLKMANVYTVSETVIHKFSTDVYLEEIPGMSFNSVLFEEVAE